MSGRVILYGATGYTGQAIAKHLAGEMDVVLAGRNADRLAKIAEPLGLPWRSFELSNEAAVHTALADGAVLLNAAGPYADTAGPLALGCIRTGTHYLDVGGEWPVFAQLMELDEQARKAGVLLLPGMGLTIAASDCLLARAVEHWPDTVKLCLGISRAHSVSRGSAASAARLFDKQSVIRRGGKLTGVPLGSLTRAFDFGDGLRETLALSWADVVTGEFTTGVGDIEVYSEVPWWQRAGYRASGLYASLTGAGVWRSAGGMIARAWPSEPGADVRGGQNYVMVVEALDRWRRPRLLKLQTHDGYGTTVLVAAEGLRRIIRGSEESGFQTPARLFGSGFVEEAGAGIFEAKAGASAA
ncbi:saccharopine dehydrogenase family protein [Altererythrobacter sp.]|uniref:saccharopine dehydrogenase family protein n=1 Tax=Altererythrobacter sp. TaxID=1872480 RepID=UPI003D0075CB